MFDRDRILTVSAKFRDDVRYELTEFELALTEQDPDGRRDNGLGATEYAIQRLVGGWYVLAALHGMAKSLRRANFSMARDGDLARWQQSLGDLALCAFEQFVDLGGIKPNFARMLCNLMSCRHGLISWLNFRN
jgi:hypothetical protein